MRPPSERTVDYDAYGHWRSNSLAQSWNAFSDSLVTGTEILDFGCGDGQLCLFLAKEKSPRRVVGVDLSAPSIERAKAALAEASVKKEVDVEFVLGSTVKLPVPDQSIDTILSFDCLEHVMAPGPILHEWFRVLRPGGRCLIEWFPFKGPWGPHMEALVPIPWANVVFGERAMFRTAELIYDLPEFYPRHWDLDEHGNKKPNKWRAWSTFKEQDYVNELSLRKFKTLAGDAGFQIARLERHSFGGSRLRSTIGRLLMSLPIVGEYFVSFTIIEMVRPKQSA